MRPGYIGFALAWILMTFVTSYRLAANAPAIFALFLVPAVILLLYGLFAQEPPQKEDAARATVIEKDGFYLPPQSPPGQRRPVVPQAPVQLARPVVRDGPGADDAVDYAKEAVFGSGKRFILMLIATVLLLVPLCGYLIRVLLGDDPAPEADDWAGLIFDGARSLVILLIYLLPGAFVIAAVRDTAGLIIGGALIIIAAYLAPAALLRFARTGSVRTAFEFSALTAMIGRIGLLSYSGFLLLCVILGFVLDIFALIPYLGIILVVVFTAPVAVFEARYFAILYDHGGGR